MRLVLLLDVGQTWRLVIEAPAGATALKLVQAHENASTRVLSARSGP